MTRPLTMIDPSKIQDNPFKLISSDWMLLTAGTLNSFNTMTASWGTMGHLWNKHICTVFVRPTRYTFRFMEQSERFTCSFFDKSYREALTFCGTKSGRDTDKIKKTGLNPLETDAGAVYFEQARLVIECRKIYTHDLDPAAFLDAQIDEEYPEKDYHRMYIGEVTRCLARV